LVVYGNGIEIGVVGNW